jgi:hypothetical protein
VIRHFLTFLYNAVHFIDAPSETPAAKISNNVILIASKDFIMPVPSHWPMVLLFFFFLFFFFFFFLTKDREAW